ncbi:MAG: hypothetical protein FJ387_23390 [Verrucomicrobia bacterium]|nr:hypothetical protein [Verrucomicrobiota bacterium]
MASFPNPGAALSAPDGDGDGIPDNWELVHGTNPDAADADADLDEDGHTTLEEYWANTHPREASSRLHLQALHFEPMQGRVALRFFAPAWRSLTVEYLDALGESPWRTLTQVPPGPVGAPIEIVDPTPMRPARLYRLAVLPY